MRGHSKLKKGTRKRCAESDDDDDGSNQSRHSHSSNNDNNDDNTDGCLNCHKIVHDNNIQVRCYECQSYICKECHWCHEFQANHEIRVCDRCDSFYCRNCDEFDQCDDCSEVVCGSCSTLLSCKFCGGGLCEECATACGRCGIVLCSRDAKFAVDCDTCKLSYCLVCLASGSKDPCVRCGHRPSKRMEQLVHLRLKSIYKAFRQNSNTDPESILQAAASAAKHAPKKPQRKNTEGKHEQQYQQDKEKADAAAAALLAELDAEEAQSEAKKSKKKKKKKQQSNNNKKDPPETSFVHQNSFERAASPHGFEDEEEEEKPAATSLPVSPDRVKEVEDTLEVELNELIEEEDLEGIERVLSSIKGVPGRALLRKNAKKAIKKLKQQQAALVEPDSCPEPDDDEHRSVTPIPPLEFGNMLKIVSHTHNKPPSTAGLKNVKGAVSGVPKSECIMHMSPNIVGWVIGKGGQRIRDLMEESSSRIWIDQDSMGPNDPRIVYVSGQRRNVEHALDMIKDLVSKAPLMSSPRQATPQAETTVKANCQKGPPMPDASEPHKEGFALKPRNASNKKGKNRIKEILTCDPRFVPLLIGRRGWTIKNIQDTSGAKVDIDQTVLPRKITVSGTKEEVKDGVEMVREVLNYPQSQLIGSPEEEKAKKSNAAPPEAAPPKHAVTPHTTPVAPKAITKVATSPSSPLHSPPSSLIMTGDAKSTVSASSSLSSTPEPSMASSSKMSYAPPAPPGPVLSPLNQRDGFVNRANDSPALLNKVTAMSPMSGHPVIYPPSADSNNNSLFGANDRFVGPQVGPPMLPQQSPIPPRVPTFPHPEGTGGFGPIPSSPMNQPSNMLHPRQQSFPPPRCGSMPGGLPSKPGNEDVGVVGGMWNAPKQQRPGGPGFHLDAAVDFLEHSHPRAASMPPSAVGEGVNELLGLGQRSNHNPAIGPRPRQSSVPAPVGGTRGRAEAQMVDSLFGPPTLTTTPSNRTGGDSSFLLTGIKGLNLNEQSTTGLWGSAPPPPQESQPHGSFLSGVNQPVSMTDPKTPQSRFTWGESNY